MSTWILQVQSDPTGGAQTGEGLTSVGLVVPKQQRIPKPLFRVTGLGVKGLKSLGRLGLKR